MYNDDSISLPAGMAPLSQIQERNIGAVLIPAYTGRDVLIYPDSLQYMHHYVSDVKVEPEIINAKWAFFPVLMIS